MLCHTPLLSQILHWWKVCQLSNYFLDKWSFSALFFTCFLTLVLVFSLRASFNCFFLSCKSNSIFWITCELILHVFGVCVCVCVRERERERERWDEHILVFVSALGSYEMGTINNLLLLLLLCFEKASSFKGKPNWRGITHPIDRNGMKNRCTAVFHLFSHPAC